LYHLEEGSRKIVETGISNIVVIMAHLDFGVCI